MSTRRVLLGAILLDLAVSPLFAWDVFTDSLQRELGSGPTVLTTVFSVGLAAFMTGVLVGGRIADSLPPRRLALVTAVGSVAGLLGSAVATSVPVMVLTFGVLLGGSTGLGYATAVRVAGTMQAGRGLALGLVVSAYAVGTAILAPLAAALLDSVGRSSTFVALAVALGLIVLAAATLLPGEAVATRSTASVRASEKPTRAGPVIALWLGFGLGSAPALAAFSHAGQLVGSAAVAALAVTLLNVGNFVGRLVAGPASDRVGRPTTLHANSALLVVSCVPLALGMSGPVALIALFLLGTQYGALSTLTPAAVSDVVPSERFGATYGRVFTGWGIAGLLAPIAAAAVAALVGYDAVYAAFIVVAALSWASVIVYMRAIAGAIRPAS